MTVPSRLPPDVWSRVLQHLHGPDKANAAQTCRDARAGSAGAWTAEDYWHAASGGQRLRGLAGQVPHDALPRAPTSAHWRSLAREIGVARAHVCSSLHVHDSFGVALYLPASFSPKRPSLWLRLAALEDPVRLETQETRWELTAQALQSTGRSGEAAALAALSRDYAALRSGSSRGDVAAVEALLESGVPLPPPPRYSLRPSVIPALTSRKRQLRSIMMVP